MPYIELNGQQFPLSGADLTIGTFDGAAIRVPGADPAARAIVALGADGRGVIRRGTAEAVVLVNGVRLGVEPSPLLHGDKVELGGVALGYGDDQKSGSTAFVSSSDIPEALRARLGTPKKPTTATGGRLVSLVDGREYSVPAGGASVGREIGNEIVVASTEVSRKHASIAPAEGGYLLSDLSTNGVLVNGVRMGKTQLLGRGDVIKIGPEEFRFYADVAKPALTPAEPTPVAPPALPLMDLLPEVEVSPTPVVAAPAPPAAAPPPSVPPAPAPSAAVPPAAPKRQPLATLEVINEGPMKGTMFEIYSPLTNIGRGAHNDVAVQDESVSDSHAKILKRDGSWWLVDMGSTNGTYAGGRRLQGEQELVGAPDVRFGGVKMTFRPAVDADAAAAKGTKAIAAVKLDSTGRMPKARSTAATPAPVEETSPIVAETKKKGCAAVIAFLVTLAAAGATTLFMLLLTHRG